MTPALHAARVATDRLPVIDIGPWYHGDPADRVAIAEKVLSACRDIGFLYVRGHRVPAEAIYAAFAAARTFFALPAAAKEVIHYRNGGFRRGYLPMLAESSDPAARGDLKEAFDCGYDPPSRALDHPNLWPAALPGWREAIETYLDAGRMLAADLFSMLALGLGLSETAFADRIDAPIATMRLLHYPPQQPPTSLDVLGIGEHCDYECLTVLAQDGVGGLQVRSTNGRWIEAPPIAGAFVVNVGEMLARWTNDLLKATAHRVINLSGAERYSIPLFFATNPETMITPLDICVGAGHPPRYPAIRADAYLAARIEEIYGTAARARSPNRGEEPDAHHSQA